MNEGYQTIYIMLKQPILCSLGMFGIPKKAVLDHSLIGSISVYRSDFVSTDHISKFPVYRIFMDTEVPKLYFMYLFDCIVSLN